MPYTLAQFAQIETEPLRKYVLTNMLREMKIGEYLPFTDVQSFRVIATRYSHLPSVSYRTLNADYTEDTSGQVDQVWESIAVLGGVVKFDRLFDKVSNTIADPQRQQLDMKILAMAIQFNDSFINGDWASDPNTFQGLQKRRTLMPARQKVIPTAASATSLDVTASASAVNAFWGKGMAKAYEYCNRGNVDLIVCNEDMLLGLFRSLLYQASAGGHMLDATKDSFDRVVTTYKGTPVVDIGLLADQSTEIILDTEVAEDAGTDATHMYFISFDEKQGITGIQLSPLEVVPDAKKDVATAKQTLIEWPVGLAGFGSYGFVQLTNILAPDTWTY
jgi:hypothetical protein